ncbi:MAG: D-alanine--D-alanine ligase [Candidatus Pacebacteria bacterium]|nr:D-alanine--D-alanine ligase [Candidatus Paceibacterota bacterium]MDD5721686.1 D-alanine--D-alanine ligase [Candidatus Paceibacterota bacterium]
MKKRIVIICGGKSGEHEVSLRSAYYVFNNLDKKKYEVSVLAIDKNGKWFFSYQFEDLVNTQGLLWKLKRNLEEVALLKAKDYGQIFSLKKKKELAQGDVFFPVIHGTFGEDGCLQGFLELLDVPYVGANVAGSAIGMNKEITKKLLKIEKIPVAEYVVIRKSDSEKDKALKIQSAITKFHYPLFIKPVSLGSSVGVSKVFSEKELQKAIKDAFQYDDQVMIEKFIKGREIECSVLGNEKPQASLPGEIQPKTFYSYKAKYLDDNEAKLLIPAPLNKKQVSQIQELSIRTFKALELQGMARIDFFLKPNGQLVVNEANTIPGFTQISMYPKLWQISGLSYSRLLDKLIQLAIQNHKGKKRLKRSYQ